MLARDDRVLATAIIGWRLAAGGWRLAAGGWRWRLAAGHRDRPVKPGAANPVLTALAGGPTDDSGFMRAKA